MSTEALNLLVVTIYPLMMIAIVCWGGTSCRHIKITQPDNQYPSVNYLFSSQFLNSFRWWEYVL